jgi:hypothetical protein
MKLVSLQEIIKNGVLCGIVIRRVEYSRGGRGYLSLMSLPQPLRTGAEKR